MPKLEVFSEATNAKTLKLKLTDIAGDVDLEVVNDAGDEIFTVLRLKDDGTLFLFNVDNGLGFQTEPDGKIKLSQGS